MLFAPLITLACLACKVGRSTAVQDVPLATSSQGMRSVANRITVDTAAIASDLRAYHSVSFQVSSLCCPL